VNKTLNNALPVVHTLKKSNLLNSRKIIARFVKGVVAITRT
jgi:hypothetical protein